MGNEIEEVKFISKIDSIRHRLGHGMFFSKDGAKWTLKMRPLLWLSALAFPVVVTVLMLRDDGRKSVFDKAPGFGTPSATQTQDKIHDVPPAAAADRVDTRKAAPSKAGPRSAQSYAPQVIAREKSVLIPPGSIVEAQLVSGASNGPVRAELTEDLVVNGETRVPSGTIVLGTGSSSQERLYVRFSTMVFRTGESTAISAEALDQGDQIAGLKGSKVGDMSAKLAAGIGLNFAGGLSEGLQDQEVQGGVALRKKSLKNAMLNGAATASLDLARETLSSIRGTVPIIEVKAKSKIFIMFREN